MTLPWSCTHCGTRHPEPGDDAKCRSHRRRTAVLAWSVLVGVIAMLVVIGGAYAAYMYGDWKCAFIECRKVVP